MQRKTTMLVVIAAMLLAIIPPAQAQQQGTTQIVPVTPPGGGSMPRGPVVPGSLSVAVVQTMQAKALILQTKMQTNSQTAADYASLASATESYFANSNETGWTKTLQTWILANPTLFTSNPTTNELEAGYASLEKAGVKTTYGAYANSILAVPLATRQAFLNTVKTKGLTAYHAQIVSELNVLAAQTRDHFSYQLAECRAPYLSGAGLYLGIVALCVAGPIGVGIAVAGLAFGAAGLFGGC